MPTAAASSSIVSALATHSGVGPSGIIDRMRWLRRTVSSNTRKPGPALGNSTASGSYTPNAFGKSLYGSASLAKRCPARLTTIDAGAPRPHSNCGTSEPSRSMPGSNITGVPQYELRLPSAAPTSVAITSPSPVLSPGLSGNTS